MFWLTDLQNWFQSTFLLVIHLIHLVRVVLIPTKNNLSYFFPSPVLKIELKEILPTSEAVMKIESHDLDQILQRRALPGFCSKPHHLLSLKLTRQTMDQGKQTPYRVILIQTFLPLPAGCPGAEGGVPSELPSLFLPWCFSHAEYH